MCFYMYTLQTAIFGHKAVANLVLQIFSLLYSTHGYIGCVKNKFIAKCLPHHQTLGTYIILHISDCIEQGWPTVLNQEATLPSLRSAAGHVCCE